MFTAIEAHIVCLNCCCGNSTVCLFSVNDIMYVLWLIWCKVLKDKIETSIVNDWERGIWGLFFFKCVCFCELWWVCGSRFGSFEVYLYLKITSKIPTEMSMGVFRISDSIFWIVVWSVKVVVIQVIMHLHIVLAVWILDFKLCVDWVLFQNLVLVLYGWL